MLCSASAWAESSGEVSTASIASRGASTGVQGSTPVASDARHAGDKPVAAAADQAAFVPESLELERNLQALTWPQFRAVVEAVPKLKRSVDAYGVIGWEYVKANYQTYRWRKSIDRMDDAQKVGLAELIARARAGEVLRAAGS